MSYLLIFTNHHRFKHGVVVSERVFFFCNDKDHYGLLSLTAPSGGCIAVKFSNIVSYLLIFTNHHRFKRGVVVSERVFFCSDKTITAYTTPSVECVVVKFCTVVNYLLIITNHRRFEHGVVVNETVFFSNDKTITAYYSIR